ncbi:hypothetical protein M427DRAFT_32536 [Gonapodya prolifera JEL478]|uniref:Uncharacterized protein n=1 Tax=Gonapodya prolifera (strain JEL478) TaxID=1344416 RepID=A0A139AET5_GONPJ|nr:hypothetical protein M427DRAFT_32536 [Gonapodya prolifera JEL478]|eukprot:KXS15336.1 hypothetical protein M427DRAFT_32536 [Gonapodya prolifera JEL478]
MLNSFPAISLSPPDGQSSLLADPSKIEGNPLSRLAGILGPLDIIELLDSLWTNHRDVAEDVVDAFRQQRLLQPSLAHKADVAAIMGSDITPQTVGHLIQLIERADKWTDAGFGSQAVQILSDVADASVEKLLEQQWDASDVLERLDSSMGEAIKAWYHEALETGVGMEEARLLALQEQCNKLRFSAEQHGYNVLHATRRMLVAVEASFSGNSGDGVEGDGNEDSESDPKTKSRDVVTNPDEDNPIDSPDPGTPVALSAGNISDLERHMSPTWRSGSDTSGDIVPDTPELNSVGRSKQPFSQLKPMPAPI